MGYTSLCLCRGILITTDPLFLSGHVSCRGRGLPWDTPASVYGILITTDPLCLSGHVSCRARGHPGDTPASVCSGVFSLQQILSASLVMYPVKLEATHGIHQPLFAQGYLPLWPLVLYPVQLETTHGIHQPLPVGFSTNRILMFVCPLDICRASNGYTNLCLCRGTKYNHYTSPFLHVSLFL